MEYKGQFPDDKDFYAKFLSELEKAQKQQTETAGEGEGGHYSRLGRWWKLSKAIAR